MPPTPIKVKLPTATQVKKKVDKARSRKHVEEKKKLSEPKEDEQMKVTHFVKDSAQLEVDRAMMMMFIPDGAPALMTVVEDPATTILNKDDKQNKPQYQRVSIIMASLRDHMPRIQHAYINQQYDVECWVWSVRCCSCMATRHHGAPFHGIEHWNGAFFETTSLARIGLTLLHTTGIIEVLVNFCFCPQHLDNFEQLLDLCLFPTTINRIETVVSFELLDDFHLHTLTSKKVAFDYYDALQQKTNPMLPHKAQNCYQVFLWVAQVHHHLATQRRAGQSHGIDWHLFHRPEKHTAVYCPACPEPSFNMEVEEIVNTPDDKKHKHTLFIVVDGCHSTQCLKKREDPDDIALNEGSAYFSAHHNFREYIKENTGEADPLTCS
uniref:CxC2-like cysteine cluster KDZ transposase-associated domain-containing protein n=1 Tax=Moniliophthora roreri TaxID=221103 RepID=A0A0W0FEF4_MONRR